MKLAAVRSPNHRTFAALGDPTRLDIVIRLGAGPASVSDLAAPFPMSLRAVLKHVAVLEGAGIVSTSKTGRTRECRLEAAALDDATDFIRQVRAGWDRRIDRIETLLSEEEKEP